MKNKSRWWRVCSVLWPTVLCFPGRLKVFVAVVACDLHKGFDDLHALVSERLGEDLKQGALFAGDVPRVTQGRQDIRGSFGREKLAR